MCGSRIPRKFRLGPFRIMILVAIVPPLLVRSIASEAKQSEPQARERRSLELRFARNDVFNMHPSPANHFAGTVTSSGKITIRNSTTSCAIMNGQTPLMISSMLILETPQTTFSTTPTGGVIRPMALLMMNRTPKYTGSMPAVLMIGIRIGVRMRIVGVMSSAVPTMTTMTMIANISRVLLPMKGCSRSTIWPRSPTP